MIVFPNAKINLGLHITAKRPDGYHEIETCFYPLSYSDVLEVIVDKSQGEACQFTSSGLHIPGDTNENLCIKAWKMMHDAFHFPPVKIHLHKILPTGAGLGGGSSDAAYTITALNKLFGCGMSEKEMETWASAIGSDCAFFISNRSSLAEGRGEILKSFPVDLSSYFIKLVMPEVHVSTAVAYSLVRPAKPLVPLSEILLKDIQEWRNFLSNDFEKSVFEKYPGLGKIKDELYAEGAVYASMSGSGSSVFGIFNSIPNKEFSGEGSCWVGRL